MTRHRRLSVVALTIGVAVAVSAPGSVATPSGESLSQNVVRIQLSGYNETPLAVSTASTGQFRAIINEKTQEVTWRLTYSALTGDVTQAHVHFGSPAQTGGIGVFLCTNQGNGPAGTQACPPGPATVTGTIRPADIIGPTAQGIAAGEFAELVKASRAGFTYVNVHSTGFPIGELRAPLTDHHGHH